jgi:signal transduction histidine kinase
MATKDDVVNSKNESIKRYARTLARYERLMEISRALISTLDINVLLEQIVLSAAELTDTEAASILLLDKLTGSLRFEAAVDITGFSLNSIEVPLEGSIAGWVVSRGEPILIADVSTEPMFFKKVDEESTFQTRNMLAVPMRAHNKVIGCLEAVNKKSDEGAFTDEDVNTMTTLAAQAAIAIENARLFQQSDLISEMVHELRTPLAAINATTHIILRPEIGEERRQQMVTTITQETKRLTRMTTEFLDLARLESGRSRLAKEPVNIEALMRRALETISHQAGERKISLHLDLHPPNLAPIIGDQEKLTQVLLNFLTNAVKYNREGGDIYVVGEQHDEHIALIVRDTGLGIAQENLPHMFEKFYRVADSEGYTTGTGLGLAIAKRIIEGHGGSVRVESELGVGTTFIITFPLAAETTVR